MIVKTKQFRWAIRSDQLEELQRGATLYSEVFFLHDKPQLLYSTESNKCSKWKIQAHLDADILHLQLIWLEHSGGYIPQEIPDKVSFRFTAYRDTEYGKEVVARFPRLPFDVKSHSLDLQRLCHQEDEVEGCPKKRNHKTDAKPPGDVSFLCMQYKNFHYCEFKRSESQCCSNAQCSKNVPLKVDRHWSPRSPSNPICLKIYPGDSLHIGVNIRAKYFVTLVAPEMSCFPWWVNN